MPTSDRYDLPFAYWLRSEQAASMGERKEAARQSMKLQVKNCDVRQAVGCAKVVPIARAAEFVVGRRNIARGRNGGGAPHD